MNWNKRGGMEWVEMKEGEWNEFKWKWGNGMNRNERGGMEWKIEKFGWGGNKLGWMERLKKRGMKQNEGD